MSEKKYLILGSQASSFYAPYCGVKLVPGKVVEYTAKCAQDGKVAQALANNHIRYATEPEIEAWVNGAGKESIAKTEEVSQELVAELEAAKAEVNELKATLAKAEEVTARRISLLKAGKEDIYGHDKESLVKYLTDSYELEKDDLKAIKKMDLPELQEYAYNLEKEAE